MKKIYFTDEEQLEARKARQLRYYYRNQKAKIQAARDYRKRLKQIKHNEDSNYRRITKEVFHQW